MALDRSPGATIARTGGRLLAVLLPLAALAVLRLLPGAPSATPPPWLEPGVTWTAAVVAGLSLVAAVAVAIRHGRVRDGADAAALGMLAVTFALVALGAAGETGIGTGIAAGAVALGLGSAAGARVVPTARGRAVAAVAVFIAIEGCLAGVLLLAGGADGALARVLLAGAAIVLALAAVATLDEAWRATAIGLGSASALVLAIGGTDIVERLVGVAGLAMAAGTLGGWLVASRLLPRGTSTEVDTGDVAGVPGPEYDERARLARELRATIDDLIAARRTIELQREELERSATVDPLSGVASRVVVLDRLRLEAAEGRRYAHPVAVMLLDIDRFAEINHAHGLAVGDTILREVALRLRLRIREADALGRVGGDAFAAILPHTDELGAATFARAVLDRLAERRFPVERGEIVVSASVGIALLRPGIPMSDEELLAAAEEALVSARAAGGNRIAFDRLHGLPRLDSPGAVGEAGGADPMEGERTS